MSSGQRVQARRYDYVVSLLLKRRLKLAYTELKVHIHIIKTEIWSLHAVCAGMCGGGAVCLKVTTIFGRTFLK